MNQELITQFNTQIVKSNTIAVILPVLVTVDTLCSAIALETALSAQGKTVSVFSGSLALPALPFFSSVPPVYSKIGSGDEFVIRVSNKHAEPNSLRYEKAADGLNIFISASNGKFVPADISTVPANDTFDLLIVLGASSFDDLGELYTGNTTLFFNTPKIAISNRADHEYFGAVNIVNTQSATLSEVVYDLLQAEQVASNDIISTGLLAGMIAQTQSFRDPKTTPDTLTKAARLVNAGARQQDIIQYLFKTKSFNLLQLWGRAMARIKTSPQTDDSAQTVLYSVLTEQDFQKTDTTPSMLPEVLIELTTMAPGGALLVLAAEITGGITIAIAGLPHAGIGKLAGKLSGAEALVATPLVGNYEYVSVTVLSASLQSFESLLLAHLKQTR